MPAWATVSNHIDKLAPGVICAAVVAIAAMFLSVHYGASAMLFALLLGMALNFLGQQGKCVAGIQFAASLVLRLGVALLGLRITFGEITALGTNTALMVVAGVILTILFGWLFGRYTSTSKHSGLLTGDAVAICGVSAALAIAAVLPRGEHHERDTSFAVIGVTALSTIAMVVYPVIVGVMGFNSHQAGIFLGGTIHDVAQVVGQAGVVLLLPVILVLSLMFRERATPDSVRPPLLPWFAVAFGALVALNSFVALPRQLLVVAGETSRFALVPAISAIGMRTSLRELTVPGMKPVMLMLAGTVFLAGIIAIMMKLYVI